MSILDNSCTILGFFLARSGLMIYAVPEIRNILWLPSPAEGRLRAARGSPSGGFAAAAALSPLPDKHPYRA